MGHPIRSVGGVCTRLPAPTPTARPPAGRRSNGPHWMNSEPATEQPKPPRCTTTALGSGRSSWRSGRNCRPTVYTSLDSCTNDQRIKNEARWQPLRQSDADAIEQAAAMLDRFNRIFLRTLRALCDMRRHSAPLIVQNGGQMNVAQQQVNLNTATSEGVV